MTEPDATPARKPLWRRITGSAWFPLIAVVVVTGLVMSFVAKPYRVPSESMLETLQVGDRVLVNRLAYLGSGPGDGPQNGDIIVFNADETWGAYRKPSNPAVRVLRDVYAFTGFGPTGWNTLVKRVIAGPGQTFSCCSDEGDILVDGEPVPEPYVANNFVFEPGTLDCNTTPRSLRCLPEVTVPENSYLMLGDNRSNSADSAQFCLGDQPADDCYLWADNDAVVGKVATIVWPPSNWSNP